ncbi:MAG TPA: trypsin-like peptidase domain-containing protein [Lacipirellulaceae bacterium]|nr:trypsin-like peptidase domain-containing protein [Lacipirellulaceae bacterium]
MPVLRLFPCGRTARLLCALAVLSPAAVRAAATDRVSPIVQAVREASPAVVNIQGQKSVTDAAPDGRSGSTTREVNGMGSGVVVDPRGYILTNLHVVEGVRQINVTLSGGQAYVAQLLARDPETDLAVIRIRTPQALPTIRLGTAHDLMVGETVVAVGNAFGYEHTVSSGIVSALHRNVQVNDVQQYLDLIQTDASINPGNSGGPLLNVDGEMVGLNVAVRAGAQGIGFAIPVDKALEVAARLMSVERLENRRHGITPLVIDGPGAPVTVARIERDSPAATSGLERGDELVHIGGTPIVRALDLERALLGRRPGETVPVVVNRRGVEVELELALVDRSGRGAPVAASRPAGAQPQGSFQESTWASFGLILEEAPKGTLRGVDPDLKGAMRVVAVRPGSSAAAQGVLAGDLLVQIHRWYTTSEQDVRYILSRGDAISKLGAVRFDILRGGKRYYGQLALNAGDSSRR